MIKKLKNKISIIISLAILIPIVGILLYNIYSMYQNTIRSVNIIEKFHPGEREESIMDYELDGVYKWEIKNDKIEETEENKKIEQYAEEALKRKSPSGIVGNYIYKRQKNKGEDKLILVESTETIKRYYYSIGISFSILILLSIFMKKGNLF